MLFKGAFGGLSPQRKPSGSDHHAQSRCLWVGHLIQQNCSSIIITKQNMHSLHV